MGYADVATALRSAMIKDPYLKILVMEGDYDMATPFLAAQYTMDHLKVTPELHKNISYAYYASGTWCISTKGARQNAQGLYQLRELRPGKSLISLSSRAGGCPIQAIVWLGWDLRVPVQVVITRPPTAGEGSALARRWQLAFGTWLFARLTTGH